MRRFARTADSRESRVSLGEAVTFALLLVLLWFTLPIAVIDSLMGAFTLIAVFIFIGLAITVLFNALFG